MKTILLFLVGIISISISAQTTNIPDQGFEQALIDLGIDSDQTINGQVLTSDVASVTNLNLSLNNNNIQDPTLIHNIDGIEDFVNLKILDISYLFNLDNGGTLDLSSFTDLEEFYMKGGTIEGADYEIVILDNNPNLNILDVDVNVLLKILRLKGGDLSVGNLLIEVGSDEYREDDPLCIEVTYPNQAENQQGVYSNWTTIGMTGMYYYSQTCTLSSEVFNKIDVQLFPNPATQQFQLKTTEEIKEIKVYSLSGKEVLKFQNQNTYDVSSLSLGIYFVQIESERGSNIEKLIKN